MSNFAFRFLPLIIDKMPKLKTNSGAKKRFKVTGTGKIKRKHAFHSHILTKKNHQAKAQPCARYLGFSC